MGEGEVPVVQPKVAPLEPHPGSVRVIASVDVGVEQDKTAVVTHAVVLSEQRAVALVATDPARADADGARGTDEFRDLAVLCVHRSTSRDDRKGYERFPETGMLSNDVHDRSPSF